MHRSKWIHVRPIGWKRVAKCIMRFGWRLDDATERTETTTTDWYEVQGEWSRYVKSTTSSKRWVELEFYRDSKWFRNLAVLLIPELIFNIAFLVRRIIGFLLPFTVPVCIVLILFGGGQAMAITETPLPQIFLVAFFTWIGLMIVEEILSRIAKRILKVK